MRKISVSLLAFIIVLCCLLTSTFLNAEDTSVSGTNLEYYHPAADPLGYFGVNSQKQMKAGQYYLNLSQSATTGKALRVAAGATTVNVVERIFTTNFVASLAATDFLTLGLNAPFHPYLKETNFTTLAPFTGRSIGDLEALLKIRVLAEKEDSLRPGVSLLVTNTFPTGDEKKFVGTSHMVPGADLILGKTFKGLNTSVNVGARFPEKKTILGIVFNDQIVYGVGADVPLSFWDRFLSVVGEIRGHFETDKVQTITAPVEFAGGIRKKFHNGLILMAGAGGGWNNAIGNPRVRGIFSLGFTPEPRAIIHSTEELAPVTSQERPVENSLVESTNSAEKPAEQFPVQSLSEKIIQQINTTVYFGFGQSTPTQESYPWILESSKLINEHPEVDLIDIDGYADGIGSPTMNLKLSQHRSKVVARIMEQQGVAKSRIKTSWYGLQNPTAPNDSTSGRRLNRRVEIVAKH